MKARRRFLVVVSAIAATVVCGALPAAAGVSRYQLANAAFRDIPSGPIIAGPDGNIWFAEKDNTGRISPTGVITQFRLPGAKNSPGWLTVGSDGAIWFTEASAIGRITMKGRVTQFPVPKALGTPGAITRISDGSLWFTTAFVKKDDTLARLLEGTPVPTSGTSPIVTNVPTWVVARIGENGSITKVVPNVAISPGAIVAGPNGLIWFTGRPGIGSITSMGSVRLYHIPRSIPGICFDSTCFADGLTVGPDHNIWFSIFDRAIGRLTPGGRFSYFKMPLTSGSSDSAPDIVQFTPDGTLWFSEVFLPTIGRFSRTGHFDEFRVSDRVRDDVVGLALGADGNLWSLLVCANAIVRVTQAGHATKFHIPGLPLDAGDKCPGLP